MLTFFSQGGRVEPAALLPEPMFLVFRKDRHDSRRDTIGPSVSAEKVCPRLKYGGQGCPLVKHDFEPDGTSCSGREVGSC